MNRPPAILIAALLAGSSAMAGSAAATSPEQSVEMLPARTLRCTLGHALNLDPSKNQTIADIRYEGAHPFVLFLPAAPAWHGPPPEPTADPDPVDPATRVLYDPDGIAADMKPVFYRVVDLWPARVEMVGLIDAPLGRFIAISDIDTENGTANLFTTRSVDAGSLDIDNVYQGGCKVELGGPSA